MRRTHKVFSVAELLALQDTPDKWIVPHMIPRSGRTLVFGTGGAYKSTIVFDLCVAIAAQGQLLRQFPVQQYGCAGAGRGAGQRAPLPTHRWRW